MPDNPNRSIEEQLKAWARKRREQTGPPFELHSATRQQLQDDVARTYASREAHSEKKSVWLALLWPRLVWALPTLAVCFVAAALLLPSFARSKSKGQLAVELAQRSKKASVEDYDKRGDRAADKPGEFRTLRDDVAKAPAAPSSPAPTVPSPASVPANGERSYVETKNSLGAKLKAGREVAAEPGTRKEVELALGEKAKETLPRAQAAPARRGVAAESESSELLRKRYGLQPAPTTKANESLAPRARSLAGQDAETRQPASEAGGGKVLSESQVALVQTNRGVVVGASGGSRPAEKSTARGLPALSADQNAAQTDNFALALKQSEDRAEPARTVSLGATDTGSQSPQRFSQVQSYRRNLNSPPMPNVLNSFQLEQNGQQVRIVDGDGSTYEGQIEAPKSELAFATKFADARQREESKKLPANGAAQNLESAVQREGANVIGQNLWFRVSGTNRTLNQPVVFVGNLLVADMNADAINRVQAGVTLAPQSAAAPSQNAPLQNQLLFQNARVQGQATVGASNRIEINAVTAP